MRIILSSFFLLIFGFTASCAAANIKPRVQILVTPSVGSIGKSMNFSGASSTDLDGSIVNYEWKFSNGENLTGVNVSTSYASSGAKYVTLLVTDNLGATSSLRRYFTVRPNVKPRALFTFNPVVSVNKPVSFNASDSIDTDGTIVSYDWIFSNGQTASGISATTTFTALGTNSATLTVTDDNGATTLIKKNFTVRPNMKPVAFFSSYPTSQYVNKSVFLIGTTSKDKDGTVVSYLWDLGNGQTSSESVVSTTYITPGRKTITLTVTDDDGATSTSKKVVNIQPTPFEQSAGAKIFLLMGQSNMAGTGDASIANEIADKRYRSYIWVYGDSGMSPMRDPIHTSNTTGTGPGSFFADAYVKNHLVPGQAMPTVILIPCAWGATPMKDWKPGGYLYERCIDKAHKVLKIKKDSKIGGVLFYQGETNTQNLTAYETWDDDFILMVAGIQATFPNTPVVFAQLATARGPYMSPSRFWNRLKESMAAINLPNVKMIKTDDIPDHLGGDGVHLTTPAYKVVGERFEEALRSMETQ